MAIRKLHYRNMLLKSLIHVCRSETGKGYVFSNADLFLRSVLWLDRIIRRLVIPP